MSARYFDSAGKDLDPALLTKGSGAYFLLLGECMTKNIASSVQESEAED